ncbi:DUF2165 family protein [Nibrella viscosa]|uniref:DUF2165 family protein n=1 Tax=Nibrella viscosa TaxID=1084524 RepID=A0ABP8KT56_9BACT
MNSRLIKILFSGAVGLYLSLVCLNNVVDYPSNFEFVRMVTQMTDTFSLERNGWRAIHHEGIQYALFILIIGGEFSSALLIFTGVFRMIRRFRAPANEFRQAKQAVTMGLALGVLLWFTVFIAVGGEWFLMWQSKTWNAQNTGFQLTACFLLFLLYHTQKDA